MREIQSCSYNDGEYDGQLNKILEENEITNKKLEDITDLLREFLKMNEGVFIKKLDTIIDLLRDIRDQR